VPKRYSQTVCIRALYHAVRVFAEIERLKTYENYFSSATNRFVFVYEACAESRLTFNSFYVYCRSLWSSKSEIRRDENVRSKC